MSSWRTTQFYERFGDLVDADATSFLFLTEPETCGATVYIGVPDDQDGGMLLGHRPPNLLADGVICTVDLHAQAGSTKLLGNTVCVVEVPVGHRNDGCLDR